MFLAVGSVEVGRRKMNARQITVMGNKVLPEAQAKAVRLEISRAFRERQDARRLVRHIHTDEERASISRAIAAVEDRMVRALWTIARQPSKGAGPVCSNRCGIPYLHDRSDVDARYTDSASGKWESVAPRPALPSSKDIDQANEALDWLLWVDDAKRKILVVGATSKRGDRNRRVNWMRLRPTLPEYAGMTVRTLQRRYTEALRMIVTELTIAELSSLSHKRA